MFLNILYKLMAQIIFIINRTKVGNYNTIDISIKGKYNEAYIFIGVSY